MLSTRLQNSSFYFVERTRTSEKRTKMKTAHAKHAELLLFICHMCKFVPLTKAKHVLPVTSSTIQVIVTTMASQHCIAVTNTAPWQLFIITTGITILAEHVTILI